MEETQNNEQHVSDINVDCKLQEIPVLGQTSLPFREI